MLSGSDAERKGYCGRPQYVLIRSYLLPSSSSDMSSLVPTCVSGNNSNEDAESLSGEAEVERLMASACSFCMFLGRPLLGVLYIGMNVKGTSVWGLSASGTRRAPLASARRRRCSFIWNKGKANRVCFKKRWALTVRTEGLKNKSDDLTSWDLSTSLRMLKSMTRQSDPPEASFEGMGMCSAESPY